MLLCVFSRSLSGLISDLVETGLVDVDRIIMVSARI